MRFNNPVNFLSLLLNLISMSIYLMCKDLISTLALTALLRPRRTISHSSRHYVTQALVLKAVLGTTFSRNYFLLHSYSSYSQKRIKTFPSPVVRPEQSQLLTLYPTCQRFLVHFPGRWCLYLLHQESNLCWSHLITSRRPIWESRLIIFHHQIEAVHFSLMLVNNSQN